MEGATEVIYRSLAECGLTHDEGPDVGGPWDPISSPSAGTFMESTRNFWWKGAPLTTAFVKKLRRTLVTGIGRRTPVGA